MFALESCKKSRTQRRRCIQPPTDYVCDCITTTITRRIRAAITVGPVELARFKPSALPDPDCLKKSSRVQVAHTHTHPHTHIYIYKKEKIKMYMRCDSVKWLCPALVLQLVFSSFHLKIIYYKCAEQVLCGGWELGEWCLKML